MIPAAEILEARILIVDDQAANVVLLAQMLAGAGYTAVTSTQDPQAVCALHRAHRYDLILLDLQMPGMDGFQVMEGLKEIETGGYLPVLVITAQPGHKLRALKAGAKDFVGKPFDLGEVLMRVHNMLEVRLLHRHETVHNLARLENAQHIAGLGDWEFDLATQRTVWSEEIYLILGLTPQDGPAGEATFDRRVHPADLSLVRQQRAAFTEGQQRVVFGHRIVRPDGTVRYVHHITETLRDGAGRPVRRSGTMQDVTDSRAADESLRQSEERHRKMLMFSPDANCMNVDGVITLVNPAFCQLLGAAAPAQLLGRPVLDVVHPDYQALVRARREQPFADRPAPPAEMKFIRLDGTAVDVEVASVAFDFEGRTEVQVIARDITERKRFAEHLLQTQKMEALGRFSGGVAHDFNNILAGISGYTELSLMLLKDNPAVRAHLGSVLQASRRAADLVRSILTFSRQQPQERRVIQLQPVVAETLKLMRATIPATIEFESSIDPAAATVLANAGQVHQVLMNLGINAWHAMKDRAGRLQVTLEEFTVDTAYAATRPRLHPGDYVRVSVSDTGCGMDQVTMRRIFEPFFTTKAPGEGSGLGLSVVHGIMDSHEGAVTVHSQPGDGTVFRLYFPVHAGAVTRPVADAVVVPRGRQERILVIDDEELLARMHEQSLIALGYEAESMTDPAAALARVLAAPDYFALVLTDQTMPGMTGLELAAELHFIRPGLPILLMTGYSLSLTATRVAAAGIRQLLLKPTTMHALGAAVHAALAAVTPIPHGPNPSD